MADGTTTIDDLQIEIGAKAQTANDAIDRLVTKLDRLQTSLSKVNGSQLSGLANGVDRLGKSMQTMNTIKTADFTRLATNLTKLGNINVSALNSSASSLSHLSRAFNTLGTVSQNTQSVVNMANSLSSLGGARVQRAITNIPLLANAMNNLMATLSRSPRVSNNVIQLTNALANLASQGARVGTASNSIETGLNRTNRSTTKASKSFGGLASAIGKFYATYFLVIRGIKGLYKSIESTADYLEAFNYFNVALGKIGSDWSHQFEQYGYESAEAYADSFSTRLQSSLKNLSGLQITLDTDGNGILTETGLKNLGLNIQEITQYASQLASVTNSVGQVGEVSLAAANSLTKLGADLSSLFNLDYSSVMQNLQSGLIGQSRALYKYGIDITNATLQTYAYELGLEKAVSEMTQAEKMQLRLIAILDQSKVSWGDLANTINSPSNMMRQFSNNLKEVGMVLGQLFIPLLQKVMPVINGVTIALKRLLVNIAGFLGIQLDLSSFGQGYSGLGEDIDGVTDAFDDATKSANKFKTVTLGIDELSINAPQDTSGTSTGVSGGIDLTDEILKATEEYEKVWNNAFKNMENKAQEWANKIEKIFEPITAPIQNLFYHISRGEWDIAGKDVSNLAIGIFDLFTNAIESVNWYSVGNKIGIFLEGLDWLEILKNVGRFFWSALEASIELWKGSFDASPIATTIFTSLIGGSILLKTLDLSAITTTVSNLGSTLTAVFGSGTLGTISAIASVFAALAIGLGVVYSKNEKVRESFKNSVLIIKDSLQPIINFFSSKVLPDIQIAFENTKNILEPLVEFLENYFVDVWQNSINPTLEEIGTDIIPLVTETFQNLWNNAIVPFGNFLNQTLVPLIKTISSLLENLWINILEPLSYATREFLFKAFENIGKILNETVIPAINTIISVLQSLWNKIQPLVEFIENNLMPIIKKNFETIGNIVNNIFGIFGGLIDFITGIFTNDWKQAWQGIVDAFSSIFGMIADIAKMPINAAIGFINGVINAAEIALNTLIGAANNISFDIPDWIPGIGGETFGISLETVDFPEIPTFEVGGFPKSASLFWANENGVPELVGNIGNQTAVASGTEITGISTAIYDTAQEEIALLREQNNLLMELLRKDMSVNIGDREIARANRRGEQSLGYALIT